MTGVKNKERRWEGKKEGRGKKSLKERGISRRAMT